MKIILSNGVVVKQLDGNNVQKYSTTIYTITWKDWDGTVLKTDYVDPGGDGTPPSEPTRETYIFTGWSGTYTNVTSSRDITATYVYDPSLFPFTSHEFTTGGGTGRYGTVLSNHIAEYNVAWASDTAFLSKGLFDGFQVWTIPGDGDYTIECFGSQGGYGYLYGLSTINPGGKGAHIKGTFTFVKGEKIILLVGHHGIDNLRNTRGGGGGGGAYVYKYTDNSILVIAGGGGGAGQYPSAGDKHGQAGNNGAPGDYGNAGNGGTNGGGGGASSYSAGGAGWTGNGVDSTYGKGGDSPLAGGEGGNEYNDGEHGGFGGGGGCYAGSGGGGGYSGGGAGGWSHSGSGGGAGSYNSGASQVNLGAVNEGDAKIIITRL